MSESLTEPHMPKGQEVRAAYKKIANYNGRKIFQSITRLDSTSHLAVDTEEPERPDEECIATLKDIGIKVQLDSGNRRSITEYRPVVEDTDRFVGYIQTIDTESLSTDTTELQLIGAVLRQMVTTVHICYSGTQSMDEEAPELQERISEEVLESFEKIDEALSAKELSPPTIYAEAMKTEPGYRYTNESRKYREAELYINPYNELIECIMARNNQTLRFHFNI